MKVKHLRKILETSLSGIEIKDSEFEDSQGRLVTRRDYVVTDKVEPADDQYVKITGTVKKGTIGRIVGIEPEIWGDNTAGLWRAKIIFQVDGRPNPSRINSDHCEYLPNYNSTTQWVIKKPDDLPFFPPHVNKYGQTINIGDWVVGLMLAKKIAFGKVVKWSHASVWVEIPQENAKPKRSCISIPYQSIVLPDFDDEDNTYNQHTLMMVLQGWDGEQKK